MSTLDLDAIEQRAREAAKVGQLRVAPGEVPEYWKVLARTGFASSQDVPALVAEIRRLQQVISDIGPWRYER